MRKMSKLRKEKMEKIKNVLLQFSSNGNRMTGEMERQSLQSEKSEQLQLFSTLVIFRFVRLNSCTLRQSLAGLQNREQWFSSFYFSTIWMTLMKYKITNCITLAV